MEGEITTLETLLLSEEWENSLFVKVEKKSLLNKFH